MIRLVLAGAAPARTRTVALSLYYDLPIHPWMRCADEIVVARLIEGDGL
jgi:hypothetical protein